MFKLLSPLSIARQGLGARYCSGSLRTSVQSPGVGLHKRLFSFASYAKGGHSSVAAIARGFRSSSSREKPNMALTLLGVLGVSSLYLAAHKPVLNDAAYANGPVSITTPGSPNIYYDAKKPVYDGAFGGKLNYHQVALGSMSGLILGYAVSRLSSVLFVFSIVAYLVGIYLRKQGVVVIDTKGLVKGAVNSVSWDELLFDQASFSVPFLTSFCIAAAL